MVPCIVKYVVVCFRVLDVFFYSIFNPYIICDVFSWKSNNAMLCTFMAAPLLVAFFYIYCWHTCALVLLFLISCILGHETVYLMILLLAGWTQLFQVQLNRKAMKAAVFLKQWLNLSQKGGKMERSAISSTSCISIP